MIKLADFENDNSIQTIAEAIGKIYKDKVIQVYWAESGGTISYSDFDLNQNMYMEGKVLWGRGDVFALEVNYVTANESRTKQVIFNAWGITLIAEKEGANVTALFLGSK